MQLINLHISAFAIALIAVVYSQILTEPKQIFNSAYRFLDNRLPWYLFNPIIGCFKCVSGQIALWFFIYKFHYDFPTHVYFISLTIFISIFINFIYGRIKNA